MFGRLHNAVWKLLTPDLVAEPPRDAVVPASLLAPEVIAALGGTGNLATQQRVAHTRIRVQVRDRARIDEVALQACSVPGVMLLPDGVVHVLTPADSLVDPDSMTFAAAATNEGVVQAGSKPRCPM